MQSFDVGYYLGRFLALTPNLIVILVGIVLAVQRLPKYPRACWFLLAALCLDALSNLSLPVLMETMMSIFAGSLNPGQGRAVWSFVWTLPYSIVSAVVWGLVLFAVFDRPDRPKFLVDEDPERDILDPPARPR